MSDISTKKKKNYISGGARRVEFGDGSSIINLDLKLSDINDLPVSEKGYIRLTVSERKETDQFGNTHSVYENDFVPDKSKSKAEEKPTAKPTVSGPRPRSPFEG